MLEVLAPLLTDIVDRKSAMSQGSIPCSGSKSVPQYIRHSGCGMIEERYPSLKNRYY